MFGIGGHCDKSHGSGGALGFASPPWAAKTGEKCPIGQALKALDLSDEQLLKLAELKGEALAHCGQVKLGFMQIVKQLAKALLSDRIEAAKVEDLVKQMQAHKAKATEQMPEKLIAFAEVLTPEQRKALRMQIVKHFLGVADCG